MNSNNEINLKQQVDECVRNFYNMSSEDRAKYIRRYHGLYPYQQVALLQCKKFMSASEKTLYSNIKKSKPVTNAVENQLPPEFEPEK